MIGGGARHLACGAVLLSSMALWAGEVQAAPLTVQLDYAAGPGCPDAADFQAVVIARLGYDPFVDGAAERVMVRIQPRDRTADGRIEWRDADGRWAGEQTFPSVSTDCGRLVRAMGFALAVQIQFLARAAEAPVVNPAAPAEPRSPPDGSSAAAPKPPGAAPAPPAQMVVPVAAADRSPPGGSRPAFGIGAGPAVGLGISSAPVLLGRLFGVVTWPHASLELAAVAGLPATTRRADGAGFSQQHLLGNAAACTLATRWSGCLLLNAGAVRMAGRDIDRPTSASVVIIQSGVRAAVRQSLGGRASLSAHADGLVNLTRWTATLDQVPVWTAPRFAAALGVDVSVRFP